jgi:PTS system nitrogen regulatory IIA component
MHFTIDEVSRLLHLPVSTVRRWIRQGNIPVYKHKGRYAFLKKDLRKWALSRGIVLAPEPQKAAVKYSAQDDRLLSAMKRGGVLREIRGTDASEVLRGVVEAAPLDPSVDRRELFARLLEREELSSTGIGRGVALPHPRSPLQTGTAEASITTCLLESPVDYGAIDALPVFVLFLMLSPSPKIHLRLLAKLSHLLRANAFVDFLRSRPSADELFSRVDDMEAAIDSASPSSRPTNAF